MCFGLTGPISGERSHLQAPRGAYFEHLSNTSSFQVLDCSNTSSCQSNSHPYPGNPGLTLEPNPWCRERWCRERWCRERAQPRDGRGCEERWCRDAGSAARWCWERAQPRVVGAHEAVARVLGWPRRTGQGAPALPASPECARCSVQPPPAQRRLRAHVRAALPFIATHSLRGPTAV